MSTAAPARYVDSPEALREVCDRLRAGPWLALDTEFIRERSYYAQLCLVQVANPELIACIDPLTLQDLGPLRELLLDPQVLKVLHAAGQDLEIFDHLWGAVPAPVFDTQLAASVLGLGEQVGYGRLVQAVLGVELDKSHARTDWSRRPLEPEQLRYAADDVRYLVEVYPRLRAELEGKGRLAWLEDDLAALTDPARYRPAPEEAWRRIRGSQHLRPRQLGALKLLAAWRERRAERLDKPRRWVLQDEVLLELARRSPADETALAKIRGLDEGAQRRLGEELLQVLARARALPESEWPQPPVRRDLGPEQDALVDALMALLRHCAQAQAISPAAIATRKDLERLVQGERELELLQGWRGRLAGRAMLDFLEGRTGLCVREGRLHPQALTARD